MSPTQISYKSLPACNFTHTFPTLKSDWQQILISLSDKPDTRTLVFLIEFNACIIRASGLPVWEPSKSKKVSLLFVLHFNVILSMIVA